MKDLTKIIMIFFVLFINSLSYVNAQTTEDSNEREAKIIFMEAKKFLYGKEWQKAVDQFKKIEENFSETKYADDSLYWLGYSMNKMSQNLQNVEKFRTIKEEALKTLETLMRQFSTSKWIDDAKQLKVEIAEELVRKGFKDYKKYLLNIVKEDEDIEIKIAAIIALQEMDKEKAFPALEKIIRKNKNPKLREKAIFVLSQFNDSRVVPLLVEAALKDSDDKIREQAIFWLGQVRRPESLKQLLEIYNNTTRIKFKKKVIFSISQYGGNKAVKELIRIYKKEKNMGLKKQVIFWLGQSNNKEAQEFILKILEM